MAEWEESFEWQIWVHGFIFSANEQMKIWINENPSMRGFVKLPIHFEDLPPETITTLREGFREGLKTRFKP